MSALIKAGEDPEDGSVVYVQDDALFMVTKMVWEPYFHIEIRSRDFGQYIGIARQSITQGTLCKVSRDEDSEVLRFLHYADT